MERMLQRKPLHDAELRAPKATVCVTGGIGYIGSCVVARLLAAGHTVHATVRPCEKEAPASRAIMEAVEKLPGADKRLRWFSADLLVDGSYDDAIAGCKFVIHTAGPVVSSVSKSQAFERVVGPAIRGVQNVLNSVNKAETVKKVVMTSSLAAVFGDAPSDPGYVYTEEDHNTVFMRNEWAYFTAKTATEWEAYAIAGLQSRWRLVTLCPGNVVGTPVVPFYNSESVQEVKRLMDGSTYPFVLPCGLPPLVDVADVAAAHVLAISVPDAYGRYLLAERGMDLPGLAGMLRQLYPTFRIPYITLPRWAFMGLLWLMGQTTVMGMVRQEFHKRAVDCSKIRKQLGLTAFIPMEHTLKDMMEGLMAEGLIPSAKAVVAHTDGADGDVKKDTTNAVAVNADATRRKAK